MPDTERVEPPECPDCGSRDMEIVMETRKVRVWLCACCSHDWTEVKTPQEQAEEREARL